ncbi:uncharacterized protein LOC117930558 [Vitis riparia]|uniref:uncharacterized protein LOC117930558 n=1 Tax=Vitis riparia TaxID=96939 RepID=UPI00155A2BF0|nr:uncharacterized protein LOC117930558 [Vitis riparia]
MGDFVSEQKSINSQLNQKIDNIESTLNKKIDGMHNELSQKIDNIQYSISRLTNLNTVNKKGKFPSQPHQNPKEIHEVESKDEDSSKVRDVQAIITLRSGKEVHQPEHDQRKAKEDKADRKEQKGKEVQMKESIIPSMDEEPQILLKEGMMKKHIPPPFPQALHGKKPIKNASEILDDLCTVKRGLNVTKQAFLTEQVSVIIQCKSPIKYKDPGCPTISVNIGGIQVEKALLDLGANVSLLPYSVYKELGLGELKPTSITLSLADRLVKIPRGVIEDVLVQVEKFYYPVDFVVLDTDPIVKGINYVPIILGRPFLATSNATINCRNGVMQLTFGNMTLELNIFHLCQKHIHPEEDEGPEEVCMIDTLVEEHCNQSMLDQFEENPDENHEDLDDGLAEPMGMNAIMSNRRQKPVILPLFKDEEEMKEAKDAILKLELKTLPAELKYAYLEEGNKAPVVISSSLTISQEDNLLRILRKHKKAIGWQISDLKGISPLICTHHIYMEEGAKPTRQPQRRLNPHMQEIVRAEVLKLLQAGIIYPILDSTWVSPTQVVPKKSGITVVKGENGDEVSTRLTTGWRVCIDYRKLNTDAKFEWDDKCQRSFELLKQFLTLAPIVRAPNWELPLK